MIDLRQARAEPDVVRAALARKGAAELFDKLLEADARWRQVGARRDEMRAAQKRLGKPTPEQVEEAKRLKAELKQLDDALAQAEAERQEVWDRVPNPPDPSAPDGFEEEDAVEAEGFPLNVYVDDELYVARETPESDAYASFQHLTVHPVGDLLEWLERPPTKLVVVGDPAELDALEARLKARFDGRLFISKSLPYFLELASPAATKGTGLAFLADRLGFTAEQTIAFGDGENDVELLQWAGYAVAVANAHEKVLALADFVCPSVDEEGVAQVIEALLDSRT